MEKITLVFDFEDKLTLSKFSRTFQEFNKAINLISQIEGELKEELLKLDEFTENEISKIIEQLSKKVSDNKRAKSLVEVLKISMNSPLEMIVYSDTAIHIAIILLGGKRIGLFKYKIPNGLLWHIRKFIERLKKK